MKDRNKNNPPRLEGFSKTKIAEAVPPAFAHGVASAERDDYPALDEAGYL